MSELQDLFEQGNPIPKGVTRCGDHYAQTEYMLIDPYASNYAARFKGFMEGIRHQQTIIDNLKAQLNNMEACYIEKKKEVEELQKTNISLEAGLRKNSKNKQRLLGKNIELQKRIDEALVIIEKHSRYIPFSAEQAIREALRGDNA